MKKIAALLAALLFAAPAQAQNTKAQMTTEINTNFGDNTTGLITPSIARTSFNDMNTSWQQAPRIRTVVATSDTIVLADYGQMVVYNQANPVAVTLPQATTTFATFNVLVKSVGTGLTTITPTISQINGAGSLILAQNQSAWIISDGTNWQLGTLVANDAVAAWTAFTPTFTCGTATFTNNSARRLTMGKTTFIEFDFTITAIGTCATLTTFTLPNTPQSRGNNVGSEVASTNVLVACSHVAGNATVNCVKQAAAVFLVNDRVVVSGVYENQ